MITKNDDLRHDPGPEENFNESKWFAYYDEQHDIWVSSRLGLEPNKKKANRWIVAAVEGEVIVNDLAADIDLPDHDWDRIKAAGLEYHTVAPMSEYQIRIEVEKLSAKINWKALTPIFDSKDCCAPLPPSLAAEHYEQSGEVSGTMQLSGKCFDIEGTGHRDHSWGIRHWEGFHSWVALMGHFDHNFFFHVERFHEQSTGVTWHGFICRNGENMPIKKAHMEPSYAGDVQFPEKFSIQLEEDKGKLVNIIGKYRFAAPLTFGSCTVMESFGAFSMGDYSASGIIEYGFTREAK